MVAHQWLAQRIGWEITQHGGLPALRLANALLAAALMPLSWAVFRRASGSRALALAGCLLYLLLVRGRFQLRPHLLNHVLGLALYLAIFVARPRLVAWQTGAIAAAAALWTNLHSGAVILPAMLGVHGAVRWSELRLRRAPADAPRELGAGRPGRVLVLAAACALALLCTPNHLRLLPYLIESNRINRTLSWEWLSILHYAGHERGDRLMIVLWALLALATVACAVAAWRRGASVATPAVALFTVLLPLQSIRFSWLAFPAIACVAAELARRSPRRAGGPALEWTAIAAVAAAALLLLAPPGGIAGAKRLLSPRVGFAPERFPLGAASVLAEIELPGRLFAQPDWGGFLTLVLDERYATFADGRWVTIGERIVRDAHAIATRRPRALALLDRWEVDVALVERGWLRGEDDPARASWLPVFEGYNSAILVRRGERGAAQRAVFARYYAERGVPFDVERGFDARRAARASPGWARSHRVRRRHVDHFRPDGRHMLVGRLVEGWPAPL